VLLLAAMADGAHAQGARPDATRLEIQQALGVSPGDLDAINRGELVVRALPRTDRRYVGAVGIGRFAVTPQFLVQRLHDIESFKKNKMVLALGVLSAAPAPEELTRLTLDKADLDALRDCRPGSCDLRLGAEQMAHLKAAGLFAGPEAGAQARGDAWFRGMLAAYARSYLARGNDALMTYRDQKAALSLQAETLLLLDSSPELDLAPGLRAYLRQFPTGVLPGARDYLYWSKEDFGLKPVISMTHITISQASDAGHGVTVMSSKQVYASHYMDASLAVTIVLPVPHVANAVYVVYANRSRSIIPGGIFAPLARTIVQRRTVEGMRKTLGDTRARTEADYRASLRPRP